ncbi:unnamed protein product [Penicillium manginii]
MSEPSQGSTEHFVTKILPLYQGPSVKICLQPSNKEYVISKSLLCAESPVFSKMFNGEFLESQEQTVTLEETDDDVSVHSLEALIQWLYRRTFDLDIGGPEEHISALLRLARLADKYAITGIEDKIVPFIKDTIVSNPHPYSSSYGRDIDHNTYCLTRDHLFSASFLPSRHPVRRALASACVEGFLRSRDHKFNGEILACPSFGADLLIEIQSALYTLTPTYEVTVEDPISGERFRFKLNQV